MFSWLTDLDIVEGEESYRGVVFALVPVLVDLPPHQDDVPSPECELSVKADVNH